MSASMDKIDSSNRIARLQDQWRQVSHSPGVYLMKSAAGQVLYVGKARDLKKRLASYMLNMAGPADRIDAKTQVLLKKIENFETILTRTEKEALILEANLIKTYRPRYNVLLKDGKRYPSLCLDVRHPFPRLTIVRKTPNNGARYFGPFSSATAVHQTLKVIHKTFKLRKCSDRAFNHRQRPCLRHQMKRCLGPCCLPVTPDQYQAVVREVSLFLNGRTQDLIDAARHEMAVATQALNFEYAAVLRDKIYALAQTTEKQVVVSNDFMDRDVLALAESAAGKVIAVLAIRHGKLLSAHYHHIAETLSSDGELLSVFIRQYYDETPFVPQEIIIPMPLADDDLLAQWLAERAAHGVRLHWPRRGEKVRLVKLAGQNARQRLVEIGQSQAGLQDMLELLRVKLHLSRPPGRIECFDNSHLQGQNPVSGMVVFENGRPLTSAYRKYRLRSNSLADDYAYMHEVLTRRYGKDEKSRPFPDLLVVDGGKGQLNIALKIVDELGLAGAFAMVGLAKKDQSRGEAQDKVYLPGRANAVNWGRNEGPLMFLQRIRDEAHRHVITFQRRRQRHSLTASVLDEIKGVGPRRRANLLKHFGSLKKIREASADDIAGAPGMSRVVAEAIQTYFAQH